VPTVTPRYQLTETTDVAIRGPAHALAEPRRGRRRPWLRPDTLSDAFPRRVDNAGFRASRFTAFASPGLGHAGPRGRRTPSGGAGGARTSPIASTLGIYGDASPRLHDEAAHQVARLILPEG